MRSFAHTYRRHRFAILFFSELLTLAGQPLWTALGFETDVLRGLLALNALAAVLSAVGGKSRQILLALLGLFAVFRTVGILFDTKPLLPVSDGVWIFVALLALGGTLRAALRRGPVNAERIYAALSAYLLAGLVFGVIYWAYEQVWPGSFRILAGQQELSLSRLVYFSFVTLASLGYGDIIPMTDAARGMAILQVVSGQMYLAVLVARLVSLYATQERLRAPSDRVP
jgi:hypothetical protein